MELSWTTNQFSNIIHKFQFKNIYRFWPWLFSSDHAALLWISKTVFPVRPRPHCKKGQVSLSGTTCLVCFIWEVDHRVVLLVCGCPSMAVLWSGLQTVPHSSPAPCFPPISLFVLLMVLASFHQALTFVLCSACVQFTSSWKKIIVLIYIPQVI